MNKTKIVSFATAALILISSAGCATLSNIKVQKRDLNSAVKVAVVLYIKGDTNKAQSIIKLVQKTRADIGSVETISISGAAEFVRKNIVWRKLKPAEALVADMVINHVEAAIDAEIRNAQIPPDTLVLVHSVLDWVEQAAQLSVNYEAQSLEALRYQ